VFFSRGKAFLGSSSFMRGRVENYLRLMIIPSQKTTLQFISALSLFPTSLIYTNTIIKSGILESYQLCWKQKIVSVVVRLFSRLFTDLQLASLLVDDSRIGKAQLLPNHHQQIQSRMIFDLTDSGIFDLPTQFEVLNQTSNMIF
jgi:hypothetical protein